MLSKTSLALKCISIVGPEKTLNVSRRVFLVVKVEGFLKGGNRQL